MTQSVAALITEKIEQKSIELSHLRNDMKGISKNLNYWKTLDGKAKKLDEELARLRAMRAQIGAINKF